VKSKYKSVQVRSGPSEGASVLESIPGGLEVVKISGNAKWVQIRLDMDDGTQMTGRISKKMVESGGRQGRQLQVLIGEQVLAGVNVDVQVPVAVPPLEASTVKR